MKGFFQALCWLLVMVPLAAAAEALRLVADLWPPFTDQRLPNNGLASDLVTTALARAGYASSYAEVPWERAIHGLQRDDYDILVNAWYTDERAVFGHFSEPYLINSIRLLQRKGSTVRFGGELSDLYPYSIAVVRGYAYSPAFDQDNRLLKVAVGGFALGARMLHARRVQLTLEDEQVARYHLSQELRGIRDELEFLPQPISENGLHILVSRLHPRHRQIVEAFNKAIVAMHEDGSYERIVQRHAW